MKSKVIRLARRPVGMPISSDFEMGVVDIPSPGPGEVLLKVVYISVDPYLRGKMSGTKVPRFEVGEPISSKIIAEVVASNHADFSVGDFVSHYLLWKEFQVSDGRGLVKVEEGDFSLSAYLGVLGVTGLSAYFALLDIGKPRDGETLVVSGAAGAVGSIAGQIGKIMGCRVVGIVGTDEKAALIRNKFGFDGAINYKTAGDLSAAVAEACPAGVDVYFDNVGGEISDAVFEHLNPYARVPVCGTIAHYNDAGSAGGVVRETAGGVALLPLVVYKFLTVRGFLIADFAPRFAEGVAVLKGWLASGRLTYTETVMEGFGQLPAAFIGLFEGRNEGKMIVRV